MEVPKEHQLICSDCNQIKAYRDTPTFKSTIKKVREKQLILSNLEERLKTKKV